MMDENDQEKLDGEDDCDDEKEELLGLQGSLERRLDLTMETLSKCHKIQSEIFIAMKKEFCS